MNRLPVDVKKMIANFFFFSEERYASMLPKDAINRATSDLKTLMGLRALCSGDDSFLNGRFRSIMPRDFDSIMEGRKNMVKSIMRFKHYHVRFFLLPTLKTQRNCLQGFVERNIDLFSDDVFKMHTSRIDSVNAKMDALRRHQRVLLRRSQR